MVARPGHTDDRVQVLRDHGKGHADHRSNHAVIRGTLMTLFMLGGLSTGSPIGILCKHALLHGTLVALLVHSG